MCVRLARFTISISFSLFEFSSFFLLPATLHSLEFQVEINQFHFTLREKRTRTRTAKFPIYSHSYRYLFMCVCGNRKYRTFAIGRFKNTNIFERLFVAWAYTRTRSCVCVCRNIKQFSRRKMEYELRYILILSIQLLYMHFCNIFSAFLPISCKQTSKQTTTDWFGIGCHFHIGDIGRCWLYSAVRNCLGLWSCVGLLSLYIENAGAGTSSSQTFYKGMG